MNKISNKLNNNSNIHNNNNNNNSHNRSVNKNDNCINKTTGAAIRTHNPDLLVCLSEEHSVVY